MSSLEWSRVEAILSNALELEGDARQAYLDEACAYDPALRQEVEDLLDASDQVDAEGFLSTLAPGGNQFLKWMATHDATEALQPGASVGPYRLLRPIGQGGMGIVYLAERADGQFEKEVALKVIKRGMDTDEIVRRFRHERQILARLEHPHIARLYDGGVTEDGRPFFVMEHVEGKPIDSYCRHHALDVTARLRLFQAVCEAVQYAHRNLVVHRDLKPSNILVTADGTPKLLDFGIAKLIDDEPGSDMPLTRTMMQRLTPEYAAPEQVRGAQVTTATDVYALGIVLYELLTGRRPYDFPSRRVADIEGVICEQIPQRPSTAVRRGTATHTAEATASQPVAASSQTPVARQLTGDLDAITLQALKKEPELRYASAGELRTDIENYLQGRPVVAHDDTFWYRTGKFVRRYRSLVGVAGLAALFLLGGIAATAWQARVAMREAVRANEEATRANEEATTASAALDALVAILGEASPENVQRPTFTARDLIDAGLEHAATLENRPRVQTTLMHTLGRISLAVGEIDQADSLHRAAFAIQQQSHILEPGALADVYLYRARVAEEREQYADADSLLDLALAADPEHVPSLVNKGYVHYLRGEFAASIPYFRRAIAIDSAHMNALSNLGVAYFLSGNSDSAAVTLSKAVAIRLDATVLNNLGTIYYYGGQLDEAAAVYEQALTLNPDSYQWQGQLGSAYYWGSAPRSRAMEHYRRAAELAEETLRTVNARDPGIQSKLCTYHAMLGHERQALRWAERALESGSSDPYVLFDVAHAYEQLGLREQALDVLAAALRHGLVADYVVNEPGFRSMLEDPRAKVILTEYSTESRSG